MIDAVIKALEKALPERVTGRPLRHLFRRALLAAGAPTARSSTATTAATAAGAPAPPTTAPARSAPWRTATRASFPLELQESMYPYRIIEFGLREDSAGAGKFRGGLGFRKNYRLLGDADLQAMFDRVQISALGRARRQGRQVRANHASKKYPARQKSSTRAKAYPLNAGDLIIVETGGGGGYGPPTERPRESVERDLMRGYVSAEAAARDYGAR